MRSARRPRFCRKPGVLLRAISAELQQSDGIKLVDGACMGLLRAAGVACSSLAAALSAAHAASIAAIGAAIGAAIVAATAIAIAATAIGSKSGSRASVATSAITATALCADTHHCRGRRPGLSTHRLMELSSRDALARTPNARLQLLITGV